MTPSKEISRRQALKLAGAAAALPLVHVSTAHAAGKLSVGFWDHWVPAGNAAIGRQVEAWAGKNKVDVRVDFITSNGNKIVLAAAAEAQAKTGHDVLQFPAWEVQNHADDLEPMDDVMQRLTDKFGAVNEVCSYLGKAKGQWRAVPTSTGTQNKGPCGRISILKNAGFDVLAMYPAKPGHAPESDAWTYDTFLKAAEACKGVNMPFALGLGTTFDSVDAIGTIFKAFGAALIDAEGNINVKSDEVRQVLEYGQKLVKFLPADAVSYDDASNNRALISGKSALIFNPPSAWAVAKRDAPQVAADCWTFPAPAGPKGRFEPYLPFFWGAWNFGTNKTAAKELIEYLMQREQVEERCTAVSGYDLSPFQSMTDFNIWSEVEPPKGTVFNYPLRAWHSSKPSIAASEAAPEIAVQIYSRGTMPTMFAKLMSGQQIPQVIDWAQNELEGFVR